MNEMNDDRPGAINPAFLSLTPAPPEARGDSISQNDKLPRKETQTWVSFLSTVDTKKTVPQCACNPAQNVNFH